MVVDETVQIEAGPDLTSVAPASEHRKDRLTYNYIVGSGQC